jgi:hypothetical protein
MGLKGIVSKRVESRYRSGTVRIVAEGQEPGLRAEAGRVAQRIQHQPSKLSIVVRPAAPRRRSACEAAAE